MKLLMLGASKAQLAGIYAAKALGHDVLTLDYLQNAPGHKEALAVSYCSTFNLDDALQFAMEQKIDGVMTMGTDQPVLTSAYIASCMSLPMLISKETAYAVTDKSLMKEIFRRYDIPHMPYHLINDGENVPEFTFPAVLKPVDSQGQRGVYYIKDKGQLERYIPLSMDHSRKRQLVLEKYYPNDEITVTGWVVKGKVYVLTITDRVSFKDKEHIGVCLSHEYPTRHLKTYGYELLQWTQKIVTAFNIEEGPIYFQFFVGDEGIKINEVACRIGGAYEAHYIKRLFGIDLCDWQVRASLGLGYDSSLLKTVNPLVVHEALSVQFFFTKEGCIYTLDSRVFNSANRTMEKKEGLWEGAVFLTQSSISEGVQNATSRAGYAILYSQSSDRLEEYIKYFYGQLKVCDASGNTLLIYRPLGGRA